MSQRTPERRLGRRRSAILLGTLVGALAACTSEEPVGLPIYTNADLVLGDAPVAELASFSATVTELSFTGPIVSSTGNLLTQSVPVEFLGLSDLGIWMGNVPLGLTTWTACELVFDPASVQARAKDGTIVPMTVVDPTLTLSFPADLVIIGRFGYDRIVIDIDLEDSLEGDVVTGLFFTPVGSVTLADSTSPPDEIDDLRGVVRGFSAADETITLSAFIDQDLAIPMGVLDRQVAVQPGAILVQEDGSLFADSASFFAALQRDMTMVEALGALGADGVLEAVRVEIRDQNAGANVASLVKMEGIVAAANAGDFDLMIREIEKGAALAAPVLGSLMPADPLVINVSHGAGTVFYFPDGTVATATDLVVGQRVKVIFSDFVGLPFPAARVRILSDPFGETTITDVTGAPASVVVNVGANEPWVISGLVALPTDPITVDLAATNIFLNVEGQPMVLADDLLDGMLARVTGTLVNPTITATEVMVRPGRFRGTVTSATPPNEFSATLTDFLDPFGSSVDQVGPYNVLVAGTAVVTGDATSTVELLNLFALLGPGQTLEVLVKGVGTGVANEIVAHEIQATVN